MKEEKEIQTAWEIWNLINRLNDLLWDRYEDHFLEIYLKEEDDQFLRTTAPLGLATAQDKTKPSG
ncbi:MAG: hypothetical protein FJZ89_10195 [Chloroflexi bacterium]|nr:hypothetical protein [Chloroflexota bacterium]